MTRRQLTSFLSHTIPALHRLWAWPLSAHLKIDTKKGCCFFFSQFFFLCKTRLRKFGVFINSLHPRSKPELKSQIVPAMSLDPMDRVKPCPAKSPTSLSRNQSGMRPREPGHGHSRQSLLRLRLPLHNEITAL